MMNPNLDAGDSETALSNSDGKWKWGLLAALVLAFITSLPQIYLWHVRGSEWNGSCAYLDTDELPYAAYTNALIDGRPRRNDPYTGKDGGQFETLFSIQFLPPLAVALPARILNVSITTAFIALLPLATLAACLVIWCLLVDVTKNPELAAVGAIGVLCLGTAAAHSPLQILWGIETGYNFFPFLRRYIPALPFPIFLASILFMWRALTRNSAWAILAGLSFAILVYSYFFLWTAVAAWFFAIIVLWLIARPQDRPRVWRVCGILIAMGATALVPYAWLLTQRANTIDQTHLLEYAHTPDLFRAPELYAAILLLVLVYHARKRQLYRDPKILLTTSLLIAPFLLFNHQILTGRSLQPFHYEEFVANYWVVLAAFLVLGILRQDIPRRIILYLAVGGLGTAMLLGVQAARRTQPSNVRLDEARAVALKLGQESLDGVVFASDFSLTNSIPTNSRNPVLWSRYMYTFADVDAAAQKKRYYQHLYYSGFDDSSLSYALHTDFFARWEVFGAGRANPMLAAKHETITEEEINQAVSDYAVFAKSYDSLLAGSPMLSYAVVSPNVDLSNLDRWYERGVAEKIGRFIIYRLTPRLTVSEGSRLNRYRSGFSDLAAGR